VEKGAK